MVYHSAVNICKYLLMGCSKISSAAYSVYDLKIPCNRQRNQVVNVICKLYIQITYRRRDYNFFFSLIVFIIPHYKLHWVQQKTITQLVIPSGCLKLLANLICVWEIFIMKYGCVDLRLIGISAYVVIEIPSASNGSKPNNLEVPEGDSIKSCRMGSL